MKQALRDLKSNIRLVADKDIPVISAPVNKLANQIYAVSTGVTGSVLLGSVGVWGQNATSETIGYTGGALLGATSGWLIAEQDHPTLRTGCFDGIFYWMGTGNQSDGCGWIQYE